MPEPKPSPLPHLIEADVSRAGHAVTLRIDGVDFPWIDALVDLAVSVEPNEIPSITVRIAAERVTLSNALEPSTR